MSVITVLNGAGKSVQVDISNIGMSLTYSGSAVQTVSFEYADETYLQTFTYDGTNLIDYTPFLVQA